MRVSTPACQSCARKEHEIACRIRTLLRTDRSTGQILGPGTVSPSSGEADYWRANDTMLATWTPMPGSDPTKPASPKANTPPSLPTIQ